MDNKMLIQFVIDTSTAAKGETAEELGAAFEAFAERIKKIDALEIGVVGCEGWGARVMKEFTAETAEIPFVPSGLPFLAAALTLALDRLQMRISEIRGLGGRCFKPWLVLLTTGHCEDSLEPVLPGLEEKMKDGKLSLFPFYLGDTSADDGCRPIETVKRPLTVLPHKAEALLAWVEKTAALRIGTRFEEGIALDASGFDGWVKR